MLSRLTTATPVTAWVPPAWLKLRCLMPARDPGSSTGRAGRSAAAPIARRSLTGSLAGRPIRRNRRPSVNVTCRTDTSEGRPIATSENCRKQTDRNSTKDQLHDKAPGRGTR